MKNLRQQLHNIPEPSMQEKNTKKALIEFLQAETDLKIVDCGSWFYAWKKGVNKTAQGAIAFRVRPIRKMEGIHLRHWHV